MGSLTSCHMGAIVPPTCRRVNAGSSPGDESRTRIVARRRAWPSPVLVCGEYPYAGEWARSRGVSE